MLKIKTEKLKEAVTKSIKGSGKLPMLLLTNCIGIEVKDGKLTLTTTDGSTNLDIIIDGFSEDISFYACTDSALFSALVSKTTTDNILLDIRGNSLFFQGNGVYNLPLIQDEEGGDVRIADITPNSTEVIRIKKSDIEPLYKFNKLAIAKTKEIPQFCAYCLTNSKIYTYNTVNLCVSKSELGKNNMLLPSSVAALLELINEQDINVVFDGNTFKFYTSAICISGTVIDGFDKFPTDAADQLVTSKRFPTKVEVNKTQIANVLDRMSLFIAPEDMNAINLSLNDDYITVTNRAGNGCEQVMYLDRPEGNTIISTCVDITDFKTMINAVELDSVSLRFSEEGYVCVELINSFVVVPSISTDDEEQVDEVEEVTDAE